MPILGGAFCANAVAEKQIATRMSNDLIVNLPFASGSPTSTLYYGKCPAEHSRSAGRAGILKIDCLPNDPTPPVFYKLAPCGSQCEPKVRSLEWNKRDVAPRTHSAMFAQIGKGFFLRGSSAGMT